MLLLVHITFPFLYYIPTNPTKISQKGLSLQNYYSKQYKLYNMSNSMDKYKEILNHFPIEEDIISIRPIGNGHINDTLGVQLSDGSYKYVLQRINHNVFSDVDTLQNNIFFVTNHIRKKLKKKNEDDIDRKVLTFLPTKEGHQYFFDGENYWRVSLFIPDSTSYDEVTPELAYQAGKAFGEFQSMLADIPEGKLGETIPNFHNMEFRLEELRSAVKDNKAKRLDKVQWLVDELEKRAEDMCIQERLYREGKLVKRTNHCDTKVNNILFDKNEDKVLCVVDLDTVMPGFVLSDIGDFIRTAVNTGKEDETDFSKISVNMPVFEAYTRGYMEMAKSFLSPTEIKLLPYGGRLLTYMQTVRFLADYLNGDIYYKIDYPEHNLDRSIAQFEFLKRLEEKTSEMDQFMNQWL